MTKTQSMVSEYEVLDEKHDSTNNHCNHTVSQTPYIDATLNRFPSIRTNLVALSEALANIASEKECTKCATESAARSLVSTAKDMKTAKKNGEWSKEDKKALKTEMRTAFGGMKGDLKQMWRETPRSEA